LEASAEIAGRGSENPPEQEARNGHRDNELMRKRLGRCRRVVIEMVRAVKVRHYDKDRSENCAESLATKREKRERTARRSTADVCSNGKDAPITAALLRAIRLLFDHLVGAG
jgi:hypothetical protein